MDLDLDKNSTVTNNISADNNATSNFPIPHGTFFVVLNHMTVYLLAVEIFIGCVGNLLACYVFLSSHLIHQSCNVYLTFLVLVDTGFLLCTFFVWIDFLDIGYSVFSLNGFCQGFPYLTYVFSFLSGYTVLSFTVERFIVTFYPLHRQHMCTTKRAKLCVTGLTVFAFIFYSFPLYMSTVVRYEGYQECRPLTEFQTAATILSSIDSVITLLLPSCIIIVLNMAIAIKISSIFSAKSRSRLGLSHSSNGTAVTMELQERNTLYSSSNRTLRASSSVAQQHRTEDNRRESVVYNNSNKSSRGSFSQ